MEANICNDEDDFEQDAVDISTNFSLRDCFDYKDLSSITQAIYKNDVPMLKSLIESGYSVNGRELDYNHTPLHLAMLKNNLQILNILLEHPKIELDNKNDLGDTPLLQSIGIATDEMIYRLLDAGCNIHETNFKNTSALHLAINKQPSIAHELIKRGADVNAVNFIDGTPLHVAVRKNNLEYVSMLLYYNADTTIVDIIDQVPPLILSINRLYKLEITQELVKYCTDFTIKVEFNYNCLLVALKDQHPIVNEMVELIGNGINQITTFKESALHFSLEYPTNAEFKLIWPKINKKVLLKCRSDFLILFLECELPTKDWLECLYMILDSEIITDLCDINICNGSIFSFLLTSFKLRGIESNDRVRIVCTLLSYGTPVYTCDLNLFYEVYGIGEDLYTFTLADSACYNPEDDYFALVSYLMGKERHLNSISKELSNFFTYITELQPWNINNLCQYFALHHWLVSSETRHSGDYNKNVVEVLNNQIESKSVPSLVEFARNASRYYISQHFDVSKTYMLHQAVKDLNLPQRIKDILLFKAPIYNEPESK